MLLPGYLLGKPQLFLIFFFFFFVTDQWPTCLIILVSAEFTHNFLNAGRSWISLKFLQANKGTDSFHYYGTDLWDLILQKGYLA